MTDKILSKIAEIRKEYEEEYNTAHIYVGSPYCSSRQREIRKKLAILSALEKAIKNVGEFCDCTPPMMSDPPQDGYQCQNCVTLESIWKEIEGL